MSTAITSKGQATIPKHIRDSFGLKPGTKVIFRVNSQGELVLRPSDETGKKTRRERLEEALAALKVDNPWSGTTDEYMAIIRGED